MNEPTPTSEIVRSARQLDAALAADYERMYAAARSADAEGRVQLDAHRFAQALAEALVDPLAEQEVYSLALLAAAEGHTRLFMEEPVTEEPVATGRLTKGPFTKEPFTTRPTFMELRAAS